MALLGWSPGGEREIYSLQELSEIFDISGISKSPAIFDMDKLTYFNAEYIRKMTPEAFAAEAEPYIRQTVKNPEIDTAAIAALLQQRCEKLTDIPEKVDFFDAVGDYDLALFENKKSKCNREVAQDMLFALLPLCQTLEEWKPDLLKSALEALAQEKGVKFATLMWPLRIAVSGKTVTPGGAVEICSIIGRSETMMRIAKALELLSR